MHVQTRKPLLFGQSPAYESPAVALATYLSSIEEGCDGFVFDVRRVRQLRDIEISSSRIRNAILDYYRAYEQRSA